MIEGKVDYNGSKVDIWSSGIVLYAMLCGSLPFADPDTAKMYKKILSGNLKIPEFVSADAKDLLSQMLEVNPEKRISFSQIKKHPWFNLRKYEKLHGIDTNLFHMPIDEQMLKKMQMTGMLENKL